MSGEQTMWDEVDLRKEAVAQVSLHGTSHTLTNKGEEAVRTPELTGQGAYAKAWKGQQARGVED